MVAPRPGDRRFGRRGDRAGGSYGAGLSLPDMGVPRIKILLVSLPFLLTVALVLAGVWWMVKGMPNGLMRASFILFTMAGISLAVTSLAAADYQSGEQTRYGIRGGDVARTFAQCVAMNSPTSIGGEPITRVMVVLRSADSTWVRYPADHVWAPVREERERRAWALASLPSTAAHGRVIPCPTDSPRGDG